MSTEEFMRECGLTNENQVKHLSQIIADLGKQMIDIPSDLVLTDEEYWQLIDNPNTFKVHEQ